MEIKQLYSNDQSVSLSKIDNCDEIIKILYNPKEKLIDPCYIYDEFNYNPISILFSNEQKLRKYGNDMNYHFGYNNIFIQMVCF